MKRRVRSLTDAACLCGGTPQLRSSGVPPLILVALAFLCIHASAQLVLPPETNLFGDDIVRKLPADELGMARRVITTTEASKPAPTATGYEHALVFHDGRQFRGQIVALTKDVIEWRLPDAVELLRFPRAEVRRIVLQPEAAPSRTPMARLLVESLVPARKESSPTPATVKLPGSDWLHGDVRSTDGQSFTLTVGRDTTFQIPRALVPWIYFEKKPAPASGFWGGALDLEAWQVQAETPPEVKDGTLTALRAQSLGRWITPPVRFEVAFEVPEIAEEGLRLWLQPIGPLVNSYSTGTTVLQFGRKEIAFQYFANDFNRDATKLPEDAAAKKGPVRYRVLYDGVARQLAVLRNGRLVDLWKLSGKAADKAARAAPAPRPVQISALCFDRLPQGQSSIQLKSLRVLPWDGVAPGPDEATLSDRLAIGDEPSVRGALQAITAEELTFSGAKKPRRAGLFVQLPHEPKPLANAEAMLLFGQEGELNVAGLEIRGGQARFRTAFAPKLERPVAGLQTIAFLRREIEAPAVADVLVFKNGDELRGTLLAAAHDGALRWRIDERQEVQIKTARVAGVRLAPREGAVAEAASVELRNGDRLCGELLALDDAALRLQHATLGPLAIERGRVWSISPNPKFAAWDAGSDPAKWTAPAPATTGARSFTSSGTSARAPARWTLLDGTFVFQSRTGQRTSPFGSDDTTGLARTVREAWDRWEVRAEITHANGALPGFSLRLGGEDGSASIQATLNYGSLTLYVMDPKARARTNFKQFPLAGKLPEPSSRITVRVLVDSITGVVTFLIDGVPIAKVGQEKADRLPHLGRSVRLSPYASDALPTVVSRLAVAPWSGEQPQPGGEAAATVALTNGDVAAGAPTELREGKFLLASEVGPLELPVGRVQVVEFGGGRTPEQAAARIRLVDGSALSVERYRWAGRELTAHSAALGELRLPAEAVRELIFNPAPVRGAAGKERE